MNPSILFADTYILISKTGLLITLGVVLALDLIAVLGTGFGRAKHPVIFQSTNDMRITLFLDRSDRLGDIAKRSMLNAIVIAIIHALIFLLFGWALCVPLLVDYAKRRKHVKTTTAPLRGIPHEGVPVYPAPAANAGEGNHPFPGAGHTSTPYTPAGKP